MDKEEKERLSRYGQVVCDFANAKTVDEACFKHFQNLQSILAFSPTFAEQIKAAIPLLSAFKTSLSQPESQLVDLILKEGTIREKLFDQLSNTGTYLVENYDSEKLTLVVYKEKDSDADWEERPTYEMSVQEFEDQIKDHISEPLRSDISRHVNGLMEVGKQISDIKSSLSESRVRTLEHFSSQYLFLEKGVKLIQDAVRQVLDKVICGAALREDYYFSRFLEAYNSEQSELVLREGDRFELQPRVNERDYVEMNEDEDRTLQWHDRLENDLAYFLIEFVLQEKNRRLIHKCDECGKYYIADRVYTSKSGRYFCRDKCRLDYHNREDIKSGKAKAAKRKGRREGKYQ